MSTVIRQRPTKLQDVVEGVVKKLDGSRKDIDRGIIIKTQEALRLLNIRAPLEKKKLTTYDAPEIRAGILLEYVAREEKNIRLCMKNIAKALGIKNKKNLEILHGIIGNYRGTDGGTLSSTGGNLRAAAAASGPTSVRQTRHSAPPPESTIPRLAIQLSSLVHDPNGFAVKAKQLFQDMIEYVETLPHKRKQDYKNEIQRHRSAYEASCFYHVVSATQTKKLLRGPRQQRPQQQHRDINREDDRNRVLELDDILDASPDFSHGILKHVLKHLGDMMEGIEEVKKNKKPKPIENATSKSSKKTGKATATRNGNGEHAPAKKKGGTRTDQATESSSKRPAPTINSDMERKTKKNKVRPEESQSEEDDDDCASTEVDSPSLNEWREQVLTEACQSAREAIREQKGILDENIPDSEALAFAADEVLRRFGMIA